MKVAKSFRFTTRTQFAYSTGSLYSNTPFTRHSPSQQHLVPHLTLSSSTINASLLESKCSFVKSSSPLSWHSALSPTNATIARPPRTLVQSIQPINVGRNVVIRIIRRTRNSIAGYRMLDWTTVSLTVARMLERFGGRISVGYFLIFVE